MRLTQHQIVTLKRVCSEIFGSEARLYLFGSRVDDRRAGGDIDLYLVGFDRSVGQQLEAKLRFLTKVKLALGERRIDLVFAPAQGQPQLPIHLQAEQTGVLL
jgi:uncharacterized protein